VYLKEEEIVKVEEESDTIPSKCNYCMLKEVERYIFHSGRRR